MINERVELPEKVNWMELILAEPKTKYFQLSDEEKKSGKYMISI